MNLKTEIKIAKLITHLGAWGILLFCLAVGNIFFSSNLTFYVIIGCLGASAVYVFCYQIIKGYSTNSAQKLKDEK